MPQTLKKLVKVVDNLCRVYGNELYTIKSKLSDKEDECEKLKVENISLRKQVTSSFKQNAPTPTSSKTMLIGDLSISNIDENKLYNY